MSSYTERISFEERQPHHQAQDIQFSNSSDYSSQSYTWDDNAIHGQDELRFGGPIRSNMSTLTSSYHPYQFQEKEFLAQPSARRKAQHSSFEFNAHEFAPIMDPSFPSPPVTPLFHRYEGETPYNGNPSLHISTDLPHYGTNNASPLFSAPLTPLVHPRIQHLNNDYVLRSVSPFLSPLPGSGNNGTTSQNFLPMSPTAGGFMSTNKLDFRYPTPPPRPQSAPITISDIHQHPSFKFPSMKSNTPSPTTPVATPAQSNSTHPQVPISQLHMFTIENDGQKVFKCPRPYCSKIYKNPNGLKYHLERGACEMDYATAAELQMPVPPPSTEASGEESQNGPTANGVKIAHRPYICQVQGCKKRYKNLNGLKYHARVSHADLNFKVDVRGEAPV